ncbi:unnamed protein product [Schistocephalus solidus]|uniref:Big_5 domain-containing protein n=1 Tax=Schistocephalus solidus TaxID=70667 RepID=A0A183SYI1_SCHSO|nr:unnamed protein product [Schistocephalus solidus]
MLTCLGNLIVQARRRSYNQNSGVKLTPDGSLLLILLLSPAIRKFNCSESRLLPVLLGDLIDSSSFPSLSPFFASTSSSPCLDSPRSNHGASKDQFYLQSPQRFWTVFLLLMFGFQVAVLHVHASPLTPGGLQNTTVRNPALPIRAIRHPSFELSFNPPWPQADRGSRVGRSTLSIIKSFNGSVMRLYSERADLTKAYITFSESGQVDLTSNGTVEESEWSDFPF